MAVENFRLVTPIEKVDRRDMTLADPTLAYPNHSNPLLDGEWLEYDTAYKAVRAGGLLPCFVIFAERGRSDVQALRKVPVIYLGAFEADTLIMDATALALGDPLMVDNVTISALTKSGLKKHGGGADLVMGYCTRTPSTNGGKLRFIQTFA